MTDLPPGLSAPAKRALSAAGVKTLEDFRKRSAAEVKALHGVGPQAMRLLAPSGVDAYLAKLDEPERSALGKLRAQIRAAAPAAEEVISYQIPTYKQGGPLVHFKAKGKDLSLTVVSASVVKEFAKELKAFVVSGRTVHFSAANPLPSLLVKRIVKRRVAENGAGKT